MELSIRNNRINFVKKQSDGKGDVVVSYDNPGTGDWVLSKSGVVAYTGQALNAEDARIEIKSDSVIIPFKIPNERDIKPMMGASLSDIEAIVSSATAAKKDKLLAMLLWAMREDLPDISK